MDGALPAGPLDERVTGDAGLAEARPTVDPVALAVAQARIGGALFGARPAPAVGRFHVLERLGAGGAGVVYRAYDPQLDRGVALKLIRVPAGQRAGALAEARALARLAHPHVVAVHDAGELDEHLYIVMELVAGETLRRWARHPGRSRAELLEAYLQFGAGLAAAHAAGLVHRDVKPDNAVVAADGRVRVVDFGLAQALPAEGDGLDDGDGDRDRASPVAGTPGYMAPEQRRGETGDRGGRSVRVLPPCSRRSRAHPDDVARGALQVPGWLMAALARGRAADPRARFASMDALARALARDPAQAWRRGGAAAAIVVAAGAAFVGRASQDAAAVDPCSGGPAALASAWARTPRGEALAEWPPSTATGRRWRRG